MQVSLSSLNDFEFVKQIGIGQYSVVYEVRHKPTSETYAMKVISKSDVGDAAYLNFVKNEIANSMKVNSPYITKVYKSFNTDGFLYILMEYVSGATLLDYVNSMNGLSESDAHFIFEQIAKAVYHLHVEKNIVHRDLKLENILLTDDWKVKIIDFGFSKDFYDQKQDASEDSTAQFSTICGSLAYSPPEIVKKNEYSEKVDIWCLGMILYGILFDKLPFFDHRPTVNASNIVNAKLEFPKKIGIELQNLLNNLLEKDPLMRYSIKEVMQHPWMKDKKGPRKIGLPSKSYNQIFTLNRLNPLTETSPQSALSLTDLLNSQNIRKTQLAISNFNDICKVRVRERKSLRFNDSMRLGNVSMLNMITTKSAKKPLA